MANDIVQTIAEARVDARSLSEFVFKPAGFKVARRLAPTVDTLQFYINRFNSLNGDFSSSVSVALSSLNSSVSEAQGKVEYIETTVQDAINNTAIEGGVLADTFVTVTAKSTDAIPRNLRDKLSENISVYDFVNKAELDHTVGLQNFFDYIAANDCGTVYCSGHFKVSAPLVLGGSKVCLTKNVIGDCTITALNAIDKMVLMQVGAMFKWNGTFEVIGTGLTSYASRTCRIGLEIGGEYQSKRAIFNSVVAKNFNQVGIHCATNTTLSNLGDARAFDCGSGAWGEGQSLTGNITNRVDTGSSESTGQASVLTVDVLPPDISVTPTLIKVGNEYHYVNSVDEVNSTISVFPWLDTTTTTGEFRYVFGAGVYMSGADAGVLHFDKVDTGRCGVGLWYASLYGAIASNVTAQSCGVALAIGLRPDSANVSGQINGFYVEDNECNLLRITRAPIGVSILSPFEFDYSKIMYTTAPRNSTTNELVNYNNLETISIVTDGQYTTYEAKPLNSATSTHLIDVTSSNRAPENIYSNGKTVNLTLPNMQLHQAYGYQSKKIMMYGTGKNGAPTGTVLFKPPAGYTVNGVAEQSFSGFNSAAIFDVYLRFKDNNFVVGCTNQSGKTTQAYPEQVIAAGATASNNITVLGVGLGDTVQVALNKTIGDTLIYASGVSKDTVRVSHYNPTDASVTIAPSTISIVVR